MKNKLNKNTKRVFKKLSFFDVLIISVLLVLIIVFFFFFYRKSEYISITVKVTDQDILYERSMPSFLYSNHFIIGDVERDSLGRITSEITDVEKYPVGNNKEVVFVEMLVKATYDTRSKLYSSRGQNLIYGAPTRFSLSKVTFDGYIVKFPGMETNEEISEKQVIFKLKSRRLEKEVAKALQPGQSVRNSKGEELLTLEEIVTTPAEILTTDSFGNVFKKQHPFLVDVELTFQAAVTKVGTMYYLYNHIPLVIKSSEEGNFLENTDLVIENNIIENITIFDIKEL